MKGEVEQLLEMLRDEALSQWGWLLRILLACCLGAAIGFERKNRNKMAGVRTHAIVALGAALMMVVSKYGFYDIVEYDASRIASQIVSGVGFLGAGIIFVRNNTSVSGLTTAAGIWATAGVGMSMGAGLHFIAIVSAAMIIVMQILLHRINFLAQEACMMSLKIVLKNEGSEVSDIETFILSEKIEINAIKINKANAKNVKLEMELVLPAGYKKVGFIDSLMNRENVISVRG